MYNDQVKQWAFSIKLNNYANAMIIHKSYRGLIKPNFYEKGNVTRFVDKHLLIILFDLNEAIR